MPQKVRSMFIVGDVIAPAMGGDGTPPGTGTAPNGVAELFDMLDVDQDGRISRADAAATGIPDEEFLAADQNGDGYLDLHEFMIWLSGSSPG